MRYLVLVYEDMDVWGARPVGEREALARACRDNDATLLQSGYLIAAELLAPDEAAMAIRFSAGTLSVAECLVGRAPARLHAVLTLQARDLNEAIRVVATMPQTQLGPVEVCPLQP